MIELGRLGNQLFQYSALKMLYPSDYILLVGFNDLKKIITKIDAFIINIERFSKLFKYLFINLINASAMLRLIGSKYEVINNTEFNIITKKGLIPGIYLFKNSYFQHSSIINKLIPELEINELHVKNAYSWYKSKKINTETNNLVFVHIRRGDYLSWPTHTNPAVLNKEYYLKSMNIIESYVKNPIFIILTDDIQYAYDIFGSTNNIFISDNNNYIDMAIMSFCSHGILSASSYAWWGTWFSKERNGINGKYIAPKYWIGHRMNEWKPPSFKSNWIIYID